MAGVSRGAVLHYYASKEELLASALEHVFRRRTEEFRTAFARLPEQTDRVAAAIDILWEMFSGSIFYAWLELVVAARGDRAVHGDVQRVAAGVADEIQRTFTELFGTAAPANSLFAAAPHFAFALLQGLALERIVSRGEDGTVGRVLDALKTLGGIVLETKQPEEGESHVDADRRSH
jgi:AcrR family transcriptional regulator